MAAERYEAVLDRDYKGQFPEAFNTQFERVRLLVHQAQLEVSSQLGLIQYRQGFQYPMTIRFEDQAPVGLESALAYVRLMPTPTGFGQELVVNLGATRFNPIDFDTIFYHEMTHAVMNDAVGGNASMRIPHWVQEGLAQYISGEGELRVKHAAQPLSHSQVGILMADLDQPFSPYLYPQYYLDVRCLKDRFSINALQAFVRNLIAGQTTVAAAEDASGLAWDRLKKEIAECSRRAFEVEASPY